MIYSNNALIDTIRDKACCYLNGNKRDEAVLEKMQDVDRALFLPENMRQYAYFDEPVPIGFQQTCSQPSMVAFVLDMLNIREGNHILEIGSGCGYAAAVASRLCGRQGKLWAFEIIPELAALMKENIGELYPNITIINGDGSGGYPDEMPFDRIFLSAGVHSATFDKDLLLRQLTDEGILIYPEARGSLYKIVRHGTDTETIEFYGVCFVPLKGENV